MRSSFIWDRARFGGDPVAGTTAAYGSFTRRTGTPRPLHATVSTPAGLLARGSMLVPPSHPLRRDNGTLAPGSPLQLRGQPRRDRVHQPGVAFPFQPLRATCVWTQTSPATPVRKPNGMKQQLPMPDRYDLSTSCRVRALATSSWAHALATSCWAHARATSCWAHALAASDLVHDLATSCRAQARYPRLPSAAQGEVTDTGHAPANAPGRAAG